MIQKYFKISLAVLCLAVFAACEQGYEPMSNAVYFGEAQTVTSKNVTVKGTGATSTVYLSLATAADADVVATLSNDASVLEDFNRRNGTNYLVLPSSYYTMSETKCTIEAGKISSPVIDININPFDDNLEVSEKYAIPVKISSASGADILAPSDHMVILCDKIIDTQILMTTGGNTAATTVVNRYDEGIKMMNSKEWTIEFLTYSNSYSSNRHIFSINDADVVCPLFGRFGELSHEYNEIQIKICNVPLYSPTLYEPKKWYHVAITCDGTTIRLYQNGVQDYIGDSPEPNQVYVASQITLRCGNAGALSEFRIWNKVRTQAEIANNMYAVNPTSEGLEAYWKIDDGAGATVYKDYTGNGWDIPAMKGTWQAQSYPPEN